MVRAARAPGVDPVFRRPDACPYRRRASVQLACSAFGCHCDRAPRGPHDDVSDRFAWRHRHGRLLQPDEFHFGARHGGKHIPSHAGMGQTVRIRGHVNFDHNFSGLIPTTISVIQALQHGTLEARNEDVRSTDPEFRRARSRDRPVTESGRVASAADVVCVDGAVVTLDIGGKA